MWVLWLYSICYCWMCHCEILVFTFSCWEPSGDFVAVTERGCWPHHPPAFLTVNSWKWTAAAEAPSWQTACQVAVQKLRPYIWLSLLISSHLIGNITLWCFLLHVFLAWQVNTFSYAHWRERSLQRGSELQASLWALWEERTRAVWLINFAYNFLQ